MRPAKESTGTATRKANGMKGFLMLLIVALAFVFVHTNKVSAGVAYTTINLEPGSTYNFTEKKDYKKYGAIMVVIDKAGTYYLKGSPNNADMVYNTMVKINPKKNESITVFIDNVKLAPDKHAPNEMHQRSAIEIQDGGGTVRLISKNEGNYFKGQGNYPAIQKDNVNTKLIFDSDGTGVIKAYADSSGFRTCAIGCHSSDLSVIRHEYSNTTGNIFFEDGTIYAYGSQKFTHSPWRVYDQLDGGAAIGASGYSSVDGLTINGGTIYAEAGDISAAAIGTSSAVWTGATDYYPTYGSKAKNITINGGTIYTSHYRNANDIHVNDDDVNSGHGAGIGGGFRSDVENLKITGGTIRIDVPNPNQTHHDTKHLPAVGIGAGEEGNADIEISGDPDIEIWCDEVGIGAFAYRETDYSIKLYPEQPDDPSNVGWFGDARVKISGNPKIKIESWGVCIGGCKPDSSKGYVEINGGQLDLHSRHAAKWPVIGPHYRGRLKRITINGGVINAHKDFENSDSAVIGNKYYSDTDDHNNDSSYVENIEITGGTIRCTEGDRNNPSMGRIGANRGKSNDETYAHVMISGGNVYAKPLNGSNSQPYSSLESGKKVKVYCHRIQTIAGDMFLNKEIAINGGDIPLKHKDGSIYQYGLNDVYTNVMTSKMDQLYFWTPEDSELGKISLAEAPFEDITATDYYGQLQYDKSKQVYHFYPLLPINLLTGSSPDPAGGDGSASVIIGDDSLYEFERPTGNRLLIEKYNTKPDGSGVDVLSRSGAFIQGEDKHYIDDGKWVFTGKDNGRPLPSIFRDGLDLYAVTSAGKLGISYESNIPSKTSSTLKGTMPEDQEYDYNDLITFPDSSGFRLDGYRFVGWNNKADGSGTTFSHDQTNVKARDIIDLAERREIVLYACWEPIKYNVAFQSLDPQLPAAEFEYTYDEPGKVPWIEDMQRWDVQDVEFAGWYGADTSGETRFGKNDKLLNYVTIDDQGNARERILYALWTEKGNIQIRVSLDGVGVPNLADDFVLTSSDGHEYSEYFTADGSLPGSYKKKSDKNLPDGEYSVSIGERRLDPEESVFTYDNNGSAYLDLASYTVNLDSDERISSVSAEPVDGVDGNDRPYVIAPKGFEISIYAETASNSGYHASGWECDGEEPEWESGKDETYASQTIKVKGKVTLKARSEGNRYTVVFDANGGESDMEPQQFRVGESQKLSKAKMKMPGYEQGVTLSSGGTTQSIYWALSPEYFGSRTFSDEELIADPLSKVDGATVTLYAQWSPANYDVIFDENMNGSVDPRHASAMEHRKSYKYNIQGNLPTQDDIIREGWDRWTYQDRYELYGWQEALNKDAPIMKPGESFTNLCTFDEDGELKGAELSAIWIKSESGNISVTVRKDNKALSGIADRITMTAESGTEYPLIETPGIPGRYTCSEAVVSELTAGRYTISIDGYPIPEDSASFNYKPNGVNELTYDYYSVTLKAENHAESATVKIPGGEPADSAVVLSGTGVEIDAAVEDGYRFKDWTWAGDDGKPEWESGKDETYANQTITVNKKLELTAHAVGSPYHIAFDPNDAAYPKAGAATGSMDVQDMVCGEPKALSNNKFNRHGYVFDRWNTEPDGTGENYGDCQKVDELTKVEDETVTLYALWEPLTYTITYKDPYQYCDPEVVTAEYNEEIDLIDSSDPNWQPDDYKLHGWTTNAMGSIYKPGQHMGNDELCHFNDNGNLSDVTLYSVWAGDGSITATVTLDNKGIDIDPEDLVLEAEDGTIYRKCFKTVESEPGTYIFVPDSETSGEPYGGRLPEGAFSIYLDNCGNYGVPQSSASFNYSETKASSVYLAYDTVSIKAGDRVKEAYIADPKTGAEIDEIIVPENTSLSIHAAVEETGYHFGRYDVSGSMPDMQTDEADQDIVVRGPAELTATAAPNKWFVHFDANGGKGDMADQAMIYDTATNLAGNRFTREHYRFTGWNSKADGSGDAYKDGDEVKNLTSTDNDSVTIYAQWEKKQSFTISYDLNGGKLDGKTGTISVKCDEGDVITIPKAPVRKGYSFDYWKGSKYYPGDKYTVNGDHSFTAMWTKDKDDPDKPDDPDDPDDPSGGSDDPDNGSGDSGNGSGDSDNHGANSNSTPTGDDSELFFWMFLLMAAGAGLALDVVLVRQRRRKELK